ncbi:ion transporter [Microbacterium allomyrinae]|uniref:Ion transporter n=1 Tax=Microbacterium allomyrinae TaxID=2830666 RepID=A0A9X1S313_9MICO|nr:ion transporter [Microbacterium allomyrinae]MCC2031485.1 ion transporter [Microbacterium allomyrinae]
MARARERAAARAELKNTAYEIFIGILSIMSIANLVMVYAFVDDPSLQMILSVMNGLFSLIFLGDFIYRISTAPSAWRYFLLGYGWADLLASLPFPQLKILRLFRLLRVYRLMRDLGPRTIWTTLVHDRANSALMTLLLMGVLVLQYGSITILAIEENAEGANITSASDALWYTIVTISTVGYGDQFPVTNAGRLVGAMIIIVGVGIFGTFTGYLANLFLGPGKKIDAPDEETDAATAVAAPAASDSTTSAVSHAAAKGVAAGAASGAVAKGVAAAAASGQAAKGGSAGVRTTPAAAPATTDADAPAAADADADRDAHLQALLTQSETTLAEIRRLVAGVSP